MWRLLTTLPVETAKDALEIIRLYRLRWRIEEVFRVLKRDGLALEETQVESARRLFNLAALAVVAAARILQLTDARDAGARPATDVIDESAIEAAAAIGAALEGKTTRQKNPHPRGSLSWLAWITARLGGWNATTSRPDPKPWPMAGASSRPCSTVMQSPMANHLCESRSPQGGRIKEGGRAVLRDEPAMAYSIISTVRPTPHPRPPPQEGAGALTPSILPKCSRLLGRLPRASERPDRAPQDDHDGERQKAADDRHHDDVEIALAMGRVADREQRDHGAVVRQAVERAGADDRHAMQESRINALLVGDLEISAA